MNKYVRLHRSLSIEWARLHAIAWPVTHTDDGYTSIGSGPEGAHTRLARVIHVCTRVEERLDNYARQAQTMRTISDALFTASIQSLRR